MADDVNINIGSDPTGVERGSKRAKVAIKGVADEGKQLDGALRRLRSAIDPTFQAQEKMNRKLAEADRLLKANRISKEQHTQAVKLYRQELNQELAAIERNSAAGRQAAAEAKQLKQQEAAQARRVSQEKIAAAREERRVKERLERQEQQAIRTAATLARQAATQAQRAARAPSQRAIGKPDASLANTSRSIKQLENDIERAMSKAQRLSQRAADQAARAAEASTAKVAKLQQEASQRTLAQVEETQRRVVQMEQQKAAQIAAAKQAEIAAERKAADAAKQAAAEAAQAAQRKKKAKADEAKAAREAALEVERQAKAEKQAAATAQELRASLDPKFAAQQRYNQTMRQATQLLMQNKLATGEWVAIQRQAKAQMDLNVRSMGRQNAMYVQMGYQAQDVVASYASGINPMVILAQQGGQTASALAMMGGTAGKVAAFFAGPWGAAILGATMLLGYLWTANDDAETKSKDVMDAEDRRKMTLLELTDALREYTKAQREANEETVAATANQVASTTAAVSDLRRRLGVAQADLAQKQKAYDTLSAAGMGAAAGLAWVALKRQQKAVKDLETAYKEASEGMIEARAAAAQKEVELSDLEKKEQAERSAALGAYRRDMEQAAGSQKAMSDAYQDYVERLREINDRYIKLKKEEQKARKDNVKTINEEMAAYGNPLANMPKQSSGFGWRTHPVTGKKAFHAGQDLPAAKGTPVLAAQDGRVEVARYSPTLGYYVVLDHGAGVTTRYGHMAKGSLQVEEGQMVSKGQQIGGVGSTGRSTGNHLHYEVRKGGKAVDPTQGTYAIDMIEAETESVKALQQAREEALRDYVAEIQFRQELARDDIAQVLQLQDEKIEAISEFYGEESREALQANREKVRMERQLQQQIVREVEEGIEHRLRLAELAAQRESELSRSGFDSQRDAVNFNEGQGLISPGDAVSQRAAILDEEYRQQVAHEDRMYSLKVQSLRQRLALEDLLPDQKEQINRELEILEQEHLNRRLAMNAEFARGVAGIQQEAAAISNEKWREVTQTLSQSMGSALQGLWMRSITVQQAFINMADQMIFKFFDMGTKMLEDWAMKQLGMTAVQQAQDTARTASTVGSEAAKTGAVLSGTATQTGAKMTAAATEQSVEAVTTGAKIASEAIKTGAAVTGAGAQTAASSAASMTEIGNSAGAAAAGAYKSTVVIPFIGPVAAPAAAALALAAVLGFGALVSSSRGLGEVGKDGQGAILHKKETVLPAWIAEPMRQMFVSPRSSRGMMASAISGGANARAAAGTTREGDNFYYQPQHTNQSVSMEELLRRDGRTFRKWVQSEIRDGRIKVT